MLSKYYIAAVLSVALTALSQLMLKLGVTRAARRGPLWLYLNPFSLGAYAILFGVTLLTLYAYQRLPLKLAVLFQPFTYILIGMFSCLFLKERLTLRQWLGALIIIIGVVLYGLGA